MVNKVVLVGRLGSDPKTVDVNGTTVAKFSLATDETFKDRAGEKVKKTEWHSVVLWDKIANVAAQYLHKGDLVYVEGKIQSRQYDSQKDGTTHTVVEIVGRELKMLQTQGQPAQQTQQKPASRPTPRQAQSDEEILF